MPNRDAVSEFHSMLVCMPAHPHMFCSVWTSDPGGFQCSAARMHATASIYCAVEACYVISVCNVYLSILSDDIDSVLGIARAVVLI